MSTKKDLSPIGLGNKESKLLAEKLNYLLSNYQQFYQNARGFHWNIKGEKFFELHLKFEELYNNAQLKIDEIAERILTLGHTPTHAFSDYLKNSNIKEHKHITDGKKAVAIIIESLSTLLILERELLGFSANAMMSDYIREQEKLVWMYSAFLNRY
jgi:starvation-inducible DNA-binding protein